MQNCDHPLVVKLIDSFEYKNNHVLITLFAPEGNLRDLIEQTKKTQNFS